MRKIRAKTEGPPKKPMSDNDTDKELWELSTEEIQVQINSKSPEQLEAMLLQILNGRTTTFSALAAAVIEAGKLLQFWGAAEELVRTTIALKLTQRHTTN